MVMPRPSGKAQRIAEKVVPGLRRQKTRRPRKEAEEEGFMSESEATKTFNIDNKVDFQM